jgi:chemotaxis protein MotA
MMVLVGMLVVLGAVFGGYVLEHGTMAVLIQPAEFVIIGGAALGTVLISTPARIVTKLVKALSTVLRGGGVSQGAYMELLSLIYELGQTIKKDGLLSLDAHLENPSRSSILAKYPTLLRHPHAVEFLVDTLRIILLGGVPPYEIEALMAVDLEASQQEGEQTVAVLTKVGDALPSLGIVAAVLGIVITMQAIDGPPQEIGHKVAAALVGTFLGVLLAYGFVQPLGTRVETLHQSEAYYFECLKAGLLALARSVPAVLAVEFARRTIPSDVRPSFQDVERVLSGKERPAVKSAA